MLCLFSEPRQFGLWADGSNLSFTNWRAGEPNEAKSSEDCSTMVTDKEPLGQWNDSRLLRLQTKLHLQPEMRFVSHFNSRLQNDLHGGD